MPKWLHDAVFYEIYPQSFKDANGDGIGDFEGIIEKLDYIKELGCNAIWMNPCFDSPFHDAGYDVRDYKKTAERYGSNEDLIRLFDEVHKRNMHILLDLVPGHTSEEHAWFLESGKDEHNDYSDRYIWTDNWFHSPEGLNYVAGESERNGVYVLNFFKCQPALNYGFLHPTQPWQKDISDAACLATREAIKDIMRFWLDAGCDGFRVDMADSLVKNDDEKKSGTSLVWRDIRNMLDESYPEAALVSEWNRPWLAIPAGFHMDFCLDWPGNGYNLLMRDVTEGKNNSIFCKDSNRSILDFFDEYLKNYRQVRQKGRYCLITGNHDTIRASHFLDERELKLAYAFLLTMPGNPFIYYGDEIGMRYLPLPSKEGGYTRTGSRTPMQWDDTQNHGFSTARPDDLYLPVDMDEEAPTVAAQMADQDSLWHVVQSVLKIRKEEEDLKDEGNLALHYAKPDKRAFAYRRGSLLMGCNPSTEEYRMEIPKIAIGAEKIYEIGSVGRQEGVFVLGPQSFAIWKSN
ncbi:MAG: alpha-amylase family glycosyl hydrolase [Roseburia sp.]|nr:alpha-amylase family glycosyl hydrolase [Ruminococcus sp.]MCM1154369.1 alpha-amylase family glycosyl hydrolase [Roseburia sp.]MCM1242424.1 alpha-amylase family glycosyl hydrolase [Roseburia sp.]